MGLNLNFLKQAQELQEKIRKIQEGLASKTATGSSGGDMVRATVNGKHELVDLDIAAEVISREEKDMLEDLVVAAVTDAMHRIDEVIRQEMAQVTGGLNIPGMELPF
jgi:hypothetical protein